MAVPSNVRPYWLVEGQLHVLRKQRAPHTLQWLSSMEEFGAWSSCDPGLVGQKRMLWLRGCPGIGKSTIAAYMVDFLKHLYPQMRVGYFFCEGGIDGLTSPQDIVRTLAYQFTEDAQVRSS